MPDNFSAIKNLRSAHSQIIGFNAELRKTKPNKTIQTEISKAVTSLDLKISALENNSQYGVIHAAFITDIEKLLTELLQSVETLADKTLSEKFKQSIENMQSAAQELRDSLPQAPLPEKPASQTLDSKAAITAPPGPREVPCF